MSDPASGAGRAAAPARGASWASSEATRRAMVACRPRDTRPELALRSAVHRLGLRFRACARPLPGLNRTADLVFTRARLAVFLDGCFWHGCPDHRRAPKAHAGYWEAKVARNRARDAETDRLLREAGWAVLRVWEHEDPRAAAERVRAAWERILAPGGQSAEAQDKEGTGWKIAIPCGDGSRR